MNQLSTNSTAKASEPTRDCIDCGQETGNKRRNRCNPCKHIHAKKRSQELGNLCECGKPVLSKGKCSACYYRERRANSPEKRVRYDPTYTKTCGFCDHEYTTTDNRARFCSRECAARHKGGWSKSKELSVVTQARHPRAPHINGTPIAHEIPARKGLPMVAGPCAWCSEVFVGHPMTRYCSKRCHSNAAWKRKYDTRGDFNPGPRLRKFICERDNWTCQICGEPVDQGAHYREHGYATLDHIVPQSMQIVPDHSASNLRLAHMICNARRGNRVDELALTA